MSDIFSKRLCIAAEEGDSITIVKLLRRIVPLNVNVRTYPFGGSALSLAAKGGHTETVRLLLEAGADPNVYDAVQLTPLHLAAQGGHVDVVKLLLLYHADASAKTKNGMTAVDLAAYGSECWKVIHDSMRGILPVTPSQDDVVPVILRQWIPKPPPEEPDMGKKKKKDQKGKKGGKR